jgi:hypothetical protein
MTETKVCSRCGQEKPEADFPRDYKHPTRRATICKACCRDRRRSWRQADPEGTRAKQRAEYWANPDRRRGYSKQRYHARKRRDPAFAEHNRKRSNAAYHANREKIVAQRRAAYARQRDKIRRAWRLYYREHQLAFRAYCHKRRKASLACDNPFTAQDLADILRMQRGRCAICRQPIKGCPSPDHIVPLCDGGTNERRNIQATHKLCNIRKSRRDPITHMQSLGRLL